MWRFLAMPDLPDAKADGAIVFCRADPLITDLACRLLKHIEGYVLLTGGIGKDSGKLAEMGVAEAVFHADRLRNRGLDMSRVVVEPNARNGYENSMFAMDLIQQRLLPHKRLVLAGHPTSLKRLTANHIANAAARGFEAHYSWAVTDYAVDLTQIDDQREMADEVLRVGTWPGQYGWSVRPPRVPEQLMREARKISSLD